VAIADVVAAARGVGLTGTSLETAVAIAGAESGYRLDAHGDVAIGGSWGPWQVYLPAHPQYDAAWLTASYANNAAAMFSISGGGLWWTPWTTFNTGAYLQHLGEARAAINADSTGAGAAPAATRPDQLTEPFGSNLDRLLADFGGSVWVNSGFRSRAEQEALWANSAQDGVMVARPGNSYHEKGMAADLGWSTDAVIAEVHRRAGEYGLHFPLNYEDWHIEPIGSRDGSYVAETAGSTPLRGFTGSGVGGKIADALVPGSSSIGDLAEAARRMIGWFSLHNLFRIMQAQVGVALVVAGFMWANRAKLAGAMKVGASAATGGVAGAVL